MRRVGIGVAIGVGVAVASVLTPVKEKGLTLQRQAEQAGAKAVKWGWIAPITLNYSVSRTDQTGIIRTKTFEVEVNQPIFRGGAIYYSLKYGSDASHLSDLNYFQNRASLVKQAIGLILDYRITLLNLQIARLQLQNAKIDVQKKRADYLAGVGDSGLLNNAILQKNQAQLQILTLRQQLEQLREQFETISNLDIATAPLPRFKLVEKREFVHQNYNYLIAKAQSRVNYDQYRQQLGNLLPSINLMGSYTRIRQVEPFTTSDGYYQVGVGVVWQFGPATYYQTEQAKLNYFKSRLALSDTRRQLDHTYRQLMAQLRELDGELKIYKENEKLYRDLVKSTEDGIKSGTNTQLDLEMMKNSYRIALLQQKIVDLKRQKVLLELDYQLYTYRNRLDPTIDSDSPHLSFNLKGER